MAILLALLFVTGQAAADIKSTTGNIFFDSNNNGASEAVITTTGLGIGTLTPSANLHVMGNAYVNGSLGNGTASPSSTLGISGTLGFSVQSVSSNTTLSANTLVLANTSSGNLTLTLPYAGNVLGRMYSIKKSNTSNTVTVSSSNLIDTKATWTLGSGNLGLLEVVSNGSQWYVLSSLNANAVATTVPSTGLAGWWKLDETSGTTAIDSSSSGNNATFIDTPTVNQAGATASSGTSYLFDGINDGLNVTGMTNVIMDNYTLSMWYKSSSKQISWKKFFIQARHTPNSYPEGIVIFEINHLATALFQFQYFTSSGNQSYYGVAASTNIIDMNWHHITGVRDKTNGSLSIYIDGTLENSAQGSNTWTGGTADDGKVGWSQSIPAGATYIGDNGGGVVGYLDDFRYYNRALSASEVSDLYNSY